MSPEQMFSYILVPFLIFLIRVTDVSLGTLRIIFISRGISFFAALLGFFEVLIWLVAIGQIINNLHSPIHYVAYAGGFGVGNFVGIAIERKLYLGNSILRIVTQKDAADLANELNKRGHGVTCVDGEGARGPVKIIFSVVRRENVEDLLTTVKKFNPNAFFTVEDVNFVNEEYVFPAASSRKIFNKLGGFIQKKK